jgi:hypothetical protein
MDYLESIISSAYWQHLIRGGNWLVILSCLLSPSVIQDSAEPESGYVPREYRLTAVGPDNYHDACNAKDENSSRAPRRTRRSAQ